MNLKHSRFNYLVLALIIFIFYFNLFLIILTPHCLLFTNFYITSLFLEFIFFILCGFFTLFLDGLRMVDLVFFLYTFVFPNFYFLLWWFFYKNLENLSNSKISLFKNFFKWLNIVCLVFSVLTWLGVFLGTIIISVTLKITLSSIIVITEILLRKIFFEWFFSFLFSFYIIFLD